VDGDHDEIIRRANTVFMASHIPNAKLVLEKDVSHFAFLQAPDQFNADLLRFLDEVALR
jgi:pimeloyl-ACP methyl ester carboxylesterase